MPHIFFDSYHQTEVLVFRTPSHGFGVAFTEPGSKVPVNMVSRAGAAQSPPAGDDAFARLAWCEGVLQGPA